MVNSINAHLKLKVLTHTTQYFSLRLNDSIKPKQSLIITLEKIGLILNRTVLKASGFSKNHNRCF